MSGHTKEPWEAKAFPCGAFEIYGGPNAYYPVCHRASTVQHMESESYANALRICLCVNSLAEVPNGAIEANVVTRLINLVCNAVEDEDEAETEWNKEARAVVALLQEVA